MNLRHLFVAVAAALFIFGSGAANAGETINEAGALAGVVDKWNELEPDKGHKLVNYAGRYVGIPDDPTAAPKSTGDCVGKYEYMPDGSWKGAGTCTATFKGGDTLQESGRRVRISRNTSTSGPAAPANTRAPAAEARIR